MVKSEAELSRRHYNCPDWVSLAGWSSDEIPECQVRAVDVAALSRWHEKHLAPF